MDLLDDIAAQHAASQAPVPKAPASTDGDLLDQIALEHQSKLRPNEQPSAWQRFTGGLHQGPNASDAASDPNHIMAPAEAEAKAVVGHVKSVADAVHQGRYSDAAKEVGSGVASMWPPLGAARDAFDRIKQGDYAGALGTFIGGMNAASIPGDVGEPRLSELDAALNHPNAHTPASNLPIVQAATAREVKPLIEVFRPADRITEKVSSNLQTALPLIKEQIGDTKLTPENIHDLTGRAADNAIAVNRAHYQRFVDSAEQMGKTGNGDVIADAMVKAIPEKIKFENPDLYANLVKDAEVYRGQRLPMSKLDSFRQTNNALLKKLEDSSAPDKNAAVISNAHTAMLKAQQDAFRNVEYNTIDEAGGGQTATELQKRYGALKTFRDNMAIRRARQMKESGDLRDAIAGAHSVSDIGVRAMKTLFGDTPEGKIADVINNHQGRLQRLPEPGGQRFTPEDLTSPKGDPKFQWQRQLFGSEAPTIEGNTTPPGSHPPVILTKPPRADFNWQRDLFGDN